MNINFENVKAAYYRGQNILKIYSGSTLEWEYETEPIEQTTKQIWYNSNSGEIVEPYNASAMGTLVSNTAYESKCVLEYASDITAIGANAFSGCTDLEYVSIPVSATSIGDNAFDGCSALDDIYMPSVQIIGRESFKDCAFSTFTISSAVTAITADAFKGVAMESFDYDGTKAQWSAITTGDFWDEVTWITNVVHCSDGDIELYQIDYSKKYLTLVATSGGTFNFSGATSSHTLSYSTNQGKTWSTPAQVVSINVNSGDSVMWKGNGLIGVQSLGIGNFGASTATFEVQGNICSLVRDDFDSNYTFNNYDNLFYGLFKNATTLQSAENLCIKVNMGYCNTAFGSLFEGCTALTKVPSFAQITGMGNCNGIFASMFKGCTALTTAPSLPATSIPYGAYREMFANCTSLVSVPRLQATNLNGDCYNGMFQGCTALARAPQLPATTMVYQCYYGMFQGCTALARAPQLPATTLANGCYRSMFQGCTSLTRAPQLSATTMVNQCYQNMFQGCTALTTAPQLPATTLANGCYQGMFEDCTSLINAPELLAPTLANNCYNNMFHNCRNLNYLKMLGTGITESNYMNYIYYFLWNVAPSGTFEKYAKTNIPRGIGGVPNGWNIENAPYDYSQDYFTIVAKEDGDINVYGCDYYDQGKEAMGWCEIEYSTDNGETWAVAPYEEDDGPSRITFNVHSGDTIMLKYDARTLYDNPDIEWHNSTPCLFNNGDGSAQFEVQGNIMSLIYGDDFTGNTSLDYNGREIKFNGMFNGNGKLVSAENLVLPATTLVESCYEDMFNGCSLTTAPSVLPATTLAQRCYSNMFEDCSSLTTAPSVLPATTLANDCYCLMFMNCSSLTTAPELPATTLVNYCYGDMFRGCSSLNYIKMLATDISASRCLDNWVLSVANSGTFIKAESMTSLPSGTSGIPNGWTVEDYIDYSKKYLTFIAKEDGYFKFHATSKTNRISYSIDNGVNWFKQTSNDTTIEVHSGDKVMWQGSMVPEYIAGSGSFSGTTASFDVEGNVMSLIYGNNFNNQKSLSGKNYAFSYLFYTNTKVVNAENLVLPATTLSTQCYASMFQGCTSLTTAPQLPATTMTDSCYTSMFQGCTSLAQAPQLPATTLATSCYNGMFSYCTNLNYIKMLATDVSASMCLLNWVSGVAATGTFVKDKNATIPNGNSGIPYEWRVQNV
jgi:hypothetical protein